MKCKWHIFWAGNVWETDEITYLVPGDRTKNIRFDVQTKDGKFRVTLVNYDFITEQLNDIVVPTLVP